MNYRTADLISSAISLPVVIATFIAALLGSFTSWVMSFFFLERIWDKIVKPDTDVDLTDRIEMRERERVKKQMFICIFSFLFIV